MDMPTKTAAPVAAMPRRKPLAKQTLLTHLGRDREAYHGFVNPPVYRGSTVLFASMDDLVHGRNEFTYGRKGNPTLRALEDAWTQLSGAAGTVLCSSGLLAITTALLALVKAGDHILVTDSVYGPVRQFCDGMLARLGVRVRYFDPACGAGIAELFESATRLVYLESPGSLTLEIQDVPAIAAAAHARGAVVVMDNTWSTPLLFDAHGHGVDVSVEAGTKYLGGASDLLIGVASANAATWPALRAAHLTLGCMPGPEDVFLALRGLRTLELRLRESEWRALELAHWLQRRPEVERVLHPALPGHANHAIWRRDFDGSSGLFSAVLKPVAPQRLARMLDGLELFGMGYSWGGFESLVTPIDHDLQRTATTWTAAGPTLRFYAGLEDVDDLKRDLDDGFRRMNRGD